MYIWISKATGRGVGFGLGLSGIADLVDHPVDELTYRDLTTNPSKIKWAQLVTEPDVPPYVKFLIPTPITRTKVLPVKITRDGGDTPLPERSLSIALDRNGVLRIASDCEIPRNAELVLCSGSIFNPRAIVAIRAGTRAQPGLRVALEDQNTSAYVIGVPPHWTLSLVVAT